MVRQKHIGSASKAAQEHVDVADENGRQNGASDELHDEGDLEDYSSDDNDDYDGLIDPALTGPVSPPLSCPELSSPSESAGVSVASASIAQSRHLPALARALAIPSSTPDHEYTRQQMWQVLASLVSTVEELRDHIMKRPDTGARNGSASSIAGLTTASSASSVPRSDLGGVSLSGASSRFTHASSEGPNEGTEESKPLVVLEAHTREEYKKVTGIDIGQAFLWTLDEARDAFAKHAGVTRKSITQIPVTFWLRHPDDTRMIPDDDWMNEPNLTPEEVTRRENLLRNGKARRDYIRERARVHMTKLEKAELSQLEQLGNTEFDPAFGRCRKKSAHRLILEEAIRLCARDCPELRSQNLWKAADAVDRRFRSIRDAKRKQAIQVQVKQEQLEADEKSEDQAAGVAGTKASSKLKQVKNTSSSKTTITSTSTASTARATSTATKGKGAATSRKKTQGLHDDFTGSSGPQQKKARHAKGNTAGGSTSSKQQPPRQEDPPSESKKTAAPGKTAANEEIAAAREVDGVRGSGLTPGLSALMGEYGQHYPDDTSTSLPARRMPRASSPTPISAVTRLPGLVGLTGHRFGDAHGMLDPGRGDNYQRGMTASQGGAVGHHRDRKHDYELYTGESQRHGHYEHESQRHGHYEYQQYQQESQYQGQRYDDGALDYGHGMSQVHPPPTPAYAGSGSQSRPPPPPSPFMHDIHRPYAATQQ
ncbi:hypothetical protein V8E36_001497 [Tilletia maclaganii]